MDTGDKSGFIRTDADGMDIENGLVALNQVHSIAAKLWTEKSPTMPAGNQRPKPKYTRQGQQRRITPVQLPDLKFNDPRFDQHRQFGNYQNTYDSPPLQNFRNEVRQPFVSHGGYNHNVQRDSFCEHDSNRKRAQIKSLPRKPPDIQNINLFPPIGSPIGSSPEKTDCPVIQNTKIQINPFDATEEAKFDPTRERKKIFSGVQKVQTQITTTTPSETPPPKILKRQAPKPQSQSQGQESTPSSLQKEDKSEKGRSAELFAQLSSAQIEELTKLSVTFSESLDSNLCRSVLAELTLLCQLLVANNDTISANLSFSGNNSGILATLAPRVWFVTKVFESQLPLIGNISPDIIQMLIDFYPHRIPKPLRKKFETIIQKRLQSENISRNQSPKFSACVIFQTEIDGRSNFPHQKDCQDFGKQRDLFYAVREIWTSRQGQSSQGTFDPAYSKVKQLFQMNSSSTNLSRLASLFLSQCVLDLNSSQGNDTYDPSSIENVQRIFESNPSKYEKLRQRLFASNSTFDGNHSTPDPILFLKYLVQTSTSPEFVQHLIDHAIYEIRKMEDEASHEVCPSEALSMMRKINLLAQMLGFLWFLPYREDGYKKPIGPINVEVYLQSQISLRIHQGFPLNLTEILVRALAQKRLVFSLPWIIQFLSNADQVTFHLPLYKPILNFIASIYREILPIKAVKPATKTAESFCLDNKMLLRFLCGKLFGLPNFPDFYLFGSEVKHVSDFLIRKSTPLSPGLSPCLSARKEEDSVPLDQITEIGLTFLPIWFRSEMKQIIAILSTNATVRGSIPTSDTLGIVKHIRPVPHREISKTEPAGRNLQGDLELQFFQIHPSSVKKAVDFISDRISSNFMKQLRSKILVSLKKEFCEIGIFGQMALLQCKTEVSKMLNIFSEERCKESVKILLGDTLSPAVLRMCQQICTRNTNTKVIDWVNQHVTSDLFPELPATEPAAELKPNDSEPKGSPTEVVEKTWSPSSGSLFLILRTLHKTIQRLHGGLPIDEGSMDQVLDDPRLVTEKPWVTGRTFDLALTLITFSPMSFSTERQVKFISFWKKIDRDGFPKFLCPRNFVLFSMSRDLEVTFEKLSSLVKALLKENILCVNEIQESCMTLLQHDWPPTTKQSVSHFLKDLMPCMDSTEEKQVIDWIAWYCSGEEQGF